MNDTDAVVSQSGKRTVERARREAALALVEAVAKMRALGKVDPSRPLSVAITNAETAELWMTVAVEGAR